MDLDIRAVEGDDELRSFLQCDATAFGSEFKEENLERVRAFLELDRTRAAFEDGRVVGTSGSLSWELTVPGGAQLPAAAVTWVSVRSTHRRRGILRMMMGALIDDAVARGEPLAMLLASESVIYGRFGYGIATSSATYEIDRAHAALMQPATAPGRVVALERDEAEPVFRAVFDQYRRSQPGEVSRSDGWWSEVFKDRPEQRGGASPRYHLAHESEPGVWDGYASYRVHERWDGSPDYQLDAEPVIALDPHVRLALVAHLLDIDLTSRVRLAHFPVDDPLRWALVDPRRLRTVSVNDHLWVRVLDVPRALAARTYGAEGRLVLSVDGERFTLDGGPDGAACTTGGGEPDLELGAADLGALFLGGTGVRPLAAVGRVRAASSEAVALATAMFRTDPAPCCTTDF